MDEVTIMSDVTQWDGSGWRVLGKLPDDWGDVRSIEPAGDRVVVTSETGNKMILPHPKRLDK